jgi:DNA-binding GntR family transcriptional regulator
MIVTRAYEQLKDILREEIISGKIPAESRLTIAEVANRYSVSQMPVREAFQWLQGEGLIKILPHKGARVISLDVNYVQNVYELRGVIEGLLARRCLPHLTSSELEKLDDIHESLIREASDNDTKTILKLDGKFHQQIYKLSDNPEAKDVYERYAGLLRALRHKYGFTQKRLTGMIEQHHQILRALKAGNEDRLEKLARAHALGAMIDLVSLMG